MMELHRNDEAVSAAIATVLLFGGVISIISLMMLTMIPVIEELEGSVERHDMSAQMTQFNQQTTTLSEQGMPGDVVTQEFVPVDGAAILPIVPPSDPERKELCRFSLARDCHSSDNPLEPKVECRSATLLNFPLLCARQLPDKEQQRWIKKRYAGWQ